MFPIATRSVDEISAIGSDMHTWEMAREGIEGLLYKSEVLVAAWGISGLVGDARRNMRLQIEWLTDELQGRDRTIWSVVESPRHPSRWHQYVSDKYGRAGTGTLTDKLGRVLLEWQPHDLLSGRPGTNHAPK
jgi:hypothetical protein